MVQDLSINLVGPLEKDSDFTQVLTAKDPTVPLVISNVSSESHLEDPSSEQFLPENNFPSSYTGSLFKSIS